MSTYRVDVRPILEEIGGSVEVAGGLDVPRIEVGDELFALVEPASFWAVITNAGGGIVATGTVSAHVRTTCVRCLCEFESVIEGEIEGFYLRPEDEPEGDDDDAERVDAEGAVDLAPALIAALVVEAPFAPLHDEECAGLCTECGADLNTEPCSCHAHGDDEHPFAALKGLSAADGATPGESAT